jgi:hypothetical protein
MYLEGVFFNLDNSMFSQYKREGAHYIHAEKAKFDKSKIKYYRCGEIGHMKRECPKENNRNKSSPSTNQKSLDQITCFICGKKGHYATKECPQQSKSKSVTFESAHLAKSEEEHCKVILEVNTKITSILDQFNQEILTLNKQGLNQSLIANFELDTKENMNRDDMVIETGMMAVHACRIDAPPIAFAHGDFAKWLLDSGATSHFTPVMSDLLNPVELEHPIHIQVADGSCMQATHRGVVELHFTSDQGIQVNLRLMHVLFVPGLQTRLFSIESFVSDGRCSVLYSNGNVKLHFPSQLSITIQLPHVPPGTYIARTTTDLSEENIQENGFCTFIHDQQ